MRLRLELNLTIGGNDTDPPAHIEDHAGYLADEGTAVGFERKEGGDE